MHSSSFRSQTFGQEDKVRSKFLLEWLIARVAFEQGLEDATKFERIISHIQADSRIDWEGELDLETLMHRLGAYADEPTRAWVAELAARILALPDHAHSGMLIPRHGRTCSLDARADKEEGKEHPMTNGVEEDFTRRAQAEREYRKQLPTLLESHPGEWVGLNGPQMFAIAVRKSDIYKTGCNQGLPPESILVRCIEPLTEDVVFGLD